MKNTIYLILIMFFTTSCMFVKRPATPLVCTEDIELLKSRIKEELKADSVIIYTKRIQEEVYFPEIHAPIIIICNPTTNVLDFKKLPIDHFVRLDSLDQIEDNLRKETTSIAQELINICDMSEFNDLIVEYHKKDIEGNARYRFIYHYNDLLENK